MATNQDKLLEIFNSDPLGLLEIKAKPKSITSDDMLESSFDEINSFYEEQGREPEKVGTIERQLFSRLQGITENADKAEYLKQFDRFNLLDDSKLPAKEVFNSVDDIFNSSSFDSLLDSSEDIFSFNHTPKPTQDDREKADMVARRKPCENFDEYKNLFKQHQSHICSRKA